MVRGIGVFFATAAAANISAKLGTYKEIVEQSKSELESLQAAFLEEETLITTVTEIEHSADGGEGALRQFEVRPPRRDRLFDPVIGAAKIELLRQAKPQLQAFLDSVDDANPSMSGDLGDTSESRPSSLDTVI